MVERALITLQELCRLQNQPYRELMRGVRDRVDAIRDFDSAQIKHAGRPRVSVGRVSNVHIFGHTFLRTMDGKYVVERQAFQQDAIDFASTYAGRQIDTREDLFSTWIEEECIFLGGTWYDPEPNHGIPNFGHWLFEFMPRLAAFDMVGAKGPVVVYDSLPARWVEFLVLAGIPRERILKIPVEHPPAFRQVWVSSCPNYMDVDGIPRLWPHGLFWLRHRVFTNMVPPVNPFAGQRIYLGRGDAKWRRVINETDVVACLKGYGFETCELSKYDAALQVRIVAGAEFIVAAAGAASTITAFAPEECLILMHAPKTVGTGMWGSAGYARMLTQVFARIDCAVEASADSRLNESGLNEMADYSVDIAVLREKVEKGLATIKNDRRVDDGR